MTISFRILFLFFLISTPALAQFGLPPGFDQKTFSQHNETALWLLEYDSVRSRALDSLAREDEQKRKDLETFCWKDKKNNWHTICGKFDSLNHYQPAFHYITDSKGKFSKSKDKTDTSLVYSAARANHHAIAQLKKVTPAISFRMNTFMRRSDDNSIQIWCLPAVQDDGKTAWGSEFVYYFNAAGTSISATKQYNKSADSSAKDQNKEITLHYDTEKMPTAGSVYFAHCFKSEFKSISIRYKKGTSTMLYNAKEKTYSWMHSVN